MNFNYLVLHIHMNAYASYIVLNECVVNWQMDVGRLINVIM